MTTTGCATSQKPVRFKVLDGELPPGMKLFTQGVSSGGITGRPTTEGVYVFTLQVRDATGTKDTETFQITIEAPRPLMICNPSDQLSPGTVGKSYCCGNLFADGGVPDYQWAIDTESGTFTFTVRLADDRGATAERTSITMS